MSMILFLILCAGSVIGAYFSSKLVSKIFEKRRKKAEKTLDNQDEIV